MRKVLLLLVVLVCSAVAFGQDITQGSLLAISKRGAELGLCPLKSTAVKTDISGFLARVTVRQEFENSFARPIEAVYIFPLSQNGAVDDMTMTVGERVVRGRIMRRDEARQTYETAKSEGKTASLLDQERPNIFTQSVANIMPGERVVIEISYVETLKYEDGAYEFVFPMVVAPRYILRGVKDAARIRPRVAATRAGHDISIEVNLNAGVPVEAIRSSSHGVEQINFSPSASKVTLRGGRVLPNKDFILRYDVTGKRIEDAVLMHRGARGGFFTLVLQPPDKFATEDRTPKEIVFVLDTSGSMEGFPIEKAKEALWLSLDGLYPDDTFNLITFAGDTDILFDAPVAATQANIERAKAFLAGREGSGGTEMMTAIKAALAPSDAQDHLRIVCFMTDGEVGNDDEIVAEVQRHPRARVFSFGIGDSVNRSLLDRIAQEGRGEATYIALEDDGSKAAKKFYERVRTPLLTDLSIDWGGLPVTDVYPAKLGDLFSAKPVIVHGRYTGAAGGTIKLKGNVAGQPYEREIKVSLPESEAANDVLGTLWARTRIDQITSDGLKTENTTDQALLDRQITDIGLEYRLLTAFTSFVAVEDRIVNQDGKPVRVEVPIEQPKGGAKHGSSFTRVEIAARLSSPLMFSYSNGTGSGRASAQSVPARSYAALGLPALPSAPLTTSDGGSNGIAARSAPAEIDEEQPVAILDASPPPPVSAPTARTISGGVLNGRATLLPLPAYPVTGRSVNARGVVTVQVTIDERGNVIAAAAVSGHPLLRGAAEKAAMASKFVPTSLSGIRVRVTGAIVYNFVSPRATNIMVRPMTVAPVSPRDKARSLLAEKLHIWLYRIVERLRRADAKPGLNEQKFVRGGKAEIEIELSTRTLVVIDKLRAAGFEFVADTGKTRVTGRVALERLAGLVDIEEVRLILPRV